MIRTILAILYFCLFGSSVYSQDYVVENAVTKNSMININPFDENGDGSNILINYLKSVRGWQNATTNLHETPNNFDQNGNLLTSASSGDYTFFSTPIAAVRPGHYVMTWVGSGEMNAAPFKGQDHDNQVACTGISNNPGDCNNTSCNTGTLMRGYINGNILTVTTAPAAGPVNVPHLARPSWCYGLNHPNFGVCGSDAGGGSGIRSNADRTDWPRKTNCALQVGQPVSASSSISSGTYNNTTGAVSLTLSQDIGIGSGAKVIVASIGNGAVGAIQQLNGMFTTTAGTGGTKLNYTAQTGLCGSMTTSLSCTSGSYSFSGSGDVESTTVNTFGVPTIIIGKSGSANCASCTGSGGTGTYLINFSQTIASSGLPVNISPGGREEFYISGWNSNYQPDGYADRYRVLIKATTAGNRLRWPGFYNINDESDYDDQSRTALGTIVQKNYRTWMQKLNFATARDLGTSYNVANNISYWNTTRSPQYAWWEGYEARPSVWLGAITPTAAGDIYRLTTSWWQNPVGTPPYDGETVILNIPILNGQKIGDDSLSAVVNPSKLDQYNGLGNFTVDSGLPDGAYPNVPLTTVSGSGSGGVITMVVVHDGTIQQSLFYPPDPGTGYAKGDRVSFTIGGHTIGATVASVDYQAQLSLDGGASYYPIASYGGRNLWASWYLQAGFTYQLTYNSRMGEWQIGDNAVDYGGGGLFNPTPPQVFTQICAELGISPWVTEPTWAIDPQTDYPAKYAQYIKTNYPWMHPWFEGPDETWNTAQDQYSALASRAIFNMVNDPVAWYNLLFPALADQEYGKLISTLGQAVQSVYGSSGYEIAAGVYPGNNVGSLADALGTAVRVTSPDYVNQTSPAQTGYNKTPGYDYVTRLATNTYWAAWGSFGFGPSTPAWNIVDLGPPTETTLAHQFYFGNSSTRASVMSQYMQSAFASESGTKAGFLAYEALVNDCLGLSITPCPSHVQGITAYEGGNSTGTAQIIGIAQSADTQQHVVSANNSSSCVLTLGPLAVQGTSSSSWVTTFTGSITNDILTPDNGSFHNWNFGTGERLTWSGGSATITGYKPLDAYQLSMTVDSAPNLPAGTSFQLWWSAAAPGMTIQLPSYPFVANAPWHAGDVSISIRQGGLPSTGGVGMSVYDTTNRKLIGTVDWTHSNQSTVILQGPALNASQGSSDHLILSAVTETGGQSWIALAATNPTFIVGSPAGGAENTSVPLLQNGRPFNCSGYDTLTSAAISYVGSANWVTTLRTNSWLYPEAGQVDYQEYSDFVSAGGLYPSQSNEVAGGLYPWMLEPNIWNWTQDGYATAAKIGTPDSTHVTLGGTVTAEFRIGETLLGQGITETDGNGSGVNTTITGCTQGTLGAAIGAPCGDTAGDVLTLSQPVISAFASKLGAYNLNPLSSYTAITNWNAGH